MKVKELLAISRADLYIFYFETPKDDTDMAKCIISANILNDFSNFDWLLEQDVVGIDSDDNYTAIKIYVKLFHK